MARLIQNELKRPLADEILFGELRRGRHGAFVDVVDGALVLRYERKAA